MYTLSTEKQKSHKVINIRWFFHMLFSICCVLLDIINEKIFLTKPTVIYRKYLKYTGRRSVEKQFS
jgi:hypothetical protein